MNKLDEKKFPCEECREQKRRCSCESPCDRCERFNLKCVYVKAVSPRDQEYVQIAKREEMRAEIKALTDHTEMLERELRNMQSVIRIHQQQSPPLSAQDGSKKDAMSPLIPLRSPVSVTCDDQVEDRRKRRRVIAQEGPVSVAVVRGNKHQPWTLTVKDGKLAIETFIKNHSDLLARLWDMTSTLRVQDSVPFTLHAVSSYGFMIKTFNTMILNKYGKTYCRSMVNAMRISALLTPPSASSTTPLRPIETITIPLIEAYFCCRHLHHLALHVPTFTRLYVTNYSDISTSPVAMALCAAICISDHARCKHITIVAPSEALNDYGKLYYDRARRLISDRFDDPCLETFATFVFLVSYKLYAATTEDDHNGQQYYREIAERMMLMLRPKYTDMSEGETILFHRLATYLQRLLTYELAFVYKSKDKSMRETGYAPFYEACHHNNQLQWISAKDDSREVQQFIEMQKYLQKLREAIYDNSRASGVAPPDLTVLTETVIQQQIKHAAADWYLHILPDKLKLPLPLLDGKTVSDRSYYTTLQSECATKGIAPVVTTLALYDEVLLTIQSFLHKRIPGPTTSWLHLDQFWQGGRIMINRQQHPSGDKWVRRITKLLSVKHTIEYAGSDDEFFSMLKEAFFPEWPVKTSVVQIGIQAAANTVRLLRFVQKSEAWSCFFDMRILTDVCTVLFRILKFEAYLEPDDQRWMTSIRAEIDQCLAMAQKQVGKEQVGSYVQTMDQELEEYYASSAR